MSVVRAARRIATALALAAAAACARERPPMNPDPAQNTYAPSLEVQLDRFTKSPTGLYTLDTKVGTGSAADSGRTVDVFYTGWLPDGTQFDTNRGGQPFTLTIGDGMVIRGWEEGLRGMRPGGQRTLVIPADLAYGERGAGGDVPPNAVLVFKVEMVNVR